MIIIRYVHMLCWILWLDYFHGPTNPMRLVGSVFHIIREERRQRGANRRTGDA